tara:strand:- start:329 stop:682 length:354 start_codon:yes stop_codon:yes gene_type:complete
MNKSYINIGLFILRVGFSFGFMAHGFGKFDKVLRGNFEFSDPLGIGSTYSLILTAFAEFIAPILIIIGWKTRFFCIFPIITMIVAFYWRQKELALLYLLVFISIYFMGPGKYSIDKY